MEGVIKVGGTRLRRCESVAEFRVISVVMNVQTAARLGLNGTKLSKFGDELKLSYSVAQLSYQGASILERQFFRRWGVGYRGARLKGVLWKRGIVDEGGTVV